MIHLPDIWGIIKTKMPPGVWVSLEYIYKLVESNWEIDKEDFDPQTSGSSIPKWKRNVRNVLQYRKGTGEIAWKRVSHYRL